MRSSESDASAPNLEDDCASPIEGKINSHAVNNYIVESDPFAEDCEPVDDDKIDQKLDEIFSSTKQFFMEKTVPGPSTTMSRKAKKQKQKETQLRLAQQREEERLRKLDLIQKQGDQQIVKSNKHGQRKVDLVRQKTTNTTKKTLDQLQPVVQPPVYDDRRLYNEKSFDGDVLVPVKIIDKEVHEDTGDFKINYHFMMRNQTDGSSFIYGKTLIKKDSEVEKKEQIKVSKTQDKFNKRYLSPANFAFGLEGTKLPIIKKKDMDPIERHDNDEISVLQQEESTSGIEQLTGYSEEEIWAAVAERKKQIADQKIKYLQSRNTNSTSSQIEEYSGSHDPRDGFKTVDNEIETKMESIKKEEEISQSGVRQDSETLAAIAALSAQVAELTKVITQQSTELALLRAELAEKDREIKALKEQPKQEKSIAKVSEEKSEKKEILIPVEKTDKPSTSKLPPPKGKTEAKKEKKKTPSTSKPQMPPRSNTMPVSKFEDDGINKLVNMDRAKTPTEKIEVIKNTMTLPEEVRSKAVNQEVRPANAERVGEKSFAERLAAGLIRSKSTIRWTNKVVQQSSVPRPKGIQEKAWKNILKQTPETLENWEAKRKVKIFEQYKRLFYAQHVKLELQWQEAAVKAKTPKVKNDWLIAPGKVVALLRKEKLEDVLKSIQEWRNKAATYVPKDGKIAADWAKVPLPSQE